MIIQKLESQHIHGICIRTNNADEMKAEKAKIGSLHQRFDQEVEVDYASGERVFSLYYDYESDASGDFSVLVGFDGMNKEKNITTIEIPAGKYLVFSAKGKIPKIVIETWGEIWNYFSSDGCEHKRAYSTDFEWYKSQNEVEICIGVE
jgi:predicted transcriptional regulator YdeE